LYWIALIPWVLLFAQTSNLRHLGLFFKVAGLVCIASMVMFTILTVKYGFELKDIIQEHICHGKTVIIVAHSHGGWIVYSMLRHLDSPNLIVVTLGSAKFIPNCYKCKLYQLSMTNDPVTGLVDTVMLILKSKLQVGYTSAKAQIMSQFCLVDKANPSYHGLEAHNSKHYFVAIKDDLL
jgi:hypothetical protein